MRNIDTIIFDLGRVLIGIAPTGEKFVALMRAMGIPPEQAFEKYWYAEEVRRHMTGEMDSRQFFETARARFGLALDFDAFAAGWCDIFTPRPDMAELFAEVADRYTVGLLSDTDPLHWQKVLALLPWLKKVAKPTLSHEVGYLKPHPRMYAAAAANCGRDKERCLFIDDVRANVDGARFYGMPALHYTGTDKLRKDLASLCLL